MENRHQTVGRKESDQKVREQEGNLIAQRSNPARILVIEDNPADVFLLRHALDQQGEEYVIEVLRDGEEAIKFVNFQRAPEATEEPCVIVLDLHLPKHDGAAVLKAIRQEPMLAHVGVIALTTIASPRDEQEVRELGVRLYKAKPMQLEEWIELAGEILEICREHRGVMA
jgi:two-component system, chemotaxis family, response regulator Rcp1